MIYARTTSGERRRTRTLDSLSKVLVCFLCVVRLLYRERERERERERDSRDLTLCGQAIAQFTVSYAMIIYDVVIIIIMALQKNHIRCASRAVYVF